MVKKFQKFLFSFNNLEHFIVWMRTAGLPSFRKLWGKINNVLDVGNYSLVIDNRKKVNVFMKS
jgi:hypothetical protein